MINSRAARGTKVSTERVCGNHQVPSHLHHKIAHSTKSNVPSNQSSQNQHPRSRISKVCLDPESKPKALANANNRLSDRSRHEFDQNPHSVRQLDAVTSVQGLAIEIQKIKYSHIDTSLEHDNTNDKTVTSKATRSLRSKLSLYIPSTDHESGDTPSCKFTTSPMLRLTQCSHSRKRFNVLDREVDEASAQAFECGFQLDLRLAEEDVKRSYSVSSSGTFDAAPFRIRQDGLICSPSLVRGHLPLDTGLSAERKLSSVHTIRKQFIKLSVLGRGASGVVHKAIHLPSLMLVAIKDIPVYECAKRHQLIAEIKTLYNNLSTLSDESTAKAPRTLAPCPEIVCLYDAFMNPNEGYVSIVVEYMDGGSLQDIVDSGGCKPERVLANIAQCVLRGLSHLHNKHQLHRDIKPSNLLINHLGEVKISDFGIAREMEDSMAKATTFVGTLTYMSPERIASEEYSYKSDVWSLGLSLLTCALGEFPYSSRNGYWELLHKIRNEPPPNLPRGSFSVTFRDFIEKCLAKNELVRWSVKQLLDHPFIKQLARTDCHTRNATEYYQTLIKAEAQQSRSESVNRDDIDVIAESVVESYRKSGKKLIDAKRLSPQDIVAWAEGLPAMQKPKLDRLAHQIGASQQYVHQIFHTKMENMLRSFHHAHTDD